MANLCDAVFEGGGVKGIGFAGAITALEEKGYTFENVVGTSAGAIAAALVAVGYTGREIELALSEVDYTKFKEPVAPIPFRGIGSAVNLVKNYGLYKTSYFENWLNTLLEKKGKTVFGDIRTKYAHARYRYRFEAVASDISSQRMLVLPHDLVYYGIDPDGFSIAQAVQMSMSIPFFYEPFTLRDRKGGEHLIVDGGLLSNYPVWLLDDGTSNPPWPTFGLKFTSPDDAVFNQPVETGNLVEYTKAVVGTMLDAHDKRYISTAKGDFARSIMIPTQIHTASGTSVVKTTDFDITQEESHALFLNGKKAALKFLRTWDFETWKKRYRN
ncbi:patatin-like phospholipase family protein [Christensenellaceae bacterium OttesenSCG-928-M15]|nr:patatin-like phospholipase family protein [Christensenellaceae bacterium OttesenSCG-928-M15]